MSQENVPAPGDPSDPTRSRDAPPRELIERTGHRFRDRDDEELREFYGTSARGPQAAILESLPNGYSIAGRHVLDFGCGAGRVLREFVPEIESGELWGCDLHGPTIAWLKEHLSPPIRFYVNEAIPMPHPDGYFDLIYAISVFTHITHQWSAWLLELHRILKPDGFLVVTIIGPDAWELSLKNPPGEDELGMCVQRLEQGLAGTSGPRVLHSPWWLRSHWGRAFEIESLQPSGFAGTHMGCFVGRRKDVSLTRDDLERPDPEDPREIAAQRNQLAILEREAVERQRADSARSARTYEESLSWRVTRPLRALGRLSRSLRGGP
jgi:SAM-dependent methyltransferase